MERCLPLGFGHSKQLSLNKFFDPSTPSMRKGYDGREKEMGGGKKENNDVPLTSLPVDCLNAKFHAN